MADAWVRLTAGADVVNLAAGMANAACFARLAGSASGRRRVAGSLLALTFGGAALLAGLLLGGGDGWDAAGARLPLLAANVAVLGLAWQGRNR